MASQILTPVSPHPIIGWQITTGTAPDLVEALAVAATVGVSGTVVCTPMPDGTSVWEMRLSQAGYPNQVGHVGDWILYDGTRVWIISDEQRQLAYTASG